MEVEFSILNTLQSLLDIPGTASLMKGVSLLGNYGAIWITVAFCLFIVAKTRPVGFAALGAIAIEIVLCNGLIKPLAQRLRPCDIETGIDLLIGCPHDFSFPSGHTAAAFALVSALFFAKDPLYKPLFWLACLMGLSRLVLYVHFPSDVLMGALLGIFCGYLGALCAGRFVRLGNFFP